MPRPPRSASPARPKRPDRPPAQAPTRLPARGPAAVYARSLLAEYGLDARLDEATEGDAAAIDPALSPAIDWASSGAMALTGSPSEAPQFAPGPLATAARGAGLALAALAPETSLPQLDAPALLGERAAIAGLARRGRVSAGGSARLLRTRDAWLVLNLPRDEDRALVPAWLERPESAGRGIDWSGIERELATRESDPLVARGRLMGLAIARARRPIPTTRSSRSSSPPSPSGPPGPSRRPGPQIRVLDLSSLWAGPLAASLLALAGCDVLKLESPVRPDGARSGPKRFFDVLNGDKHGAALDLRDEADRSRFESLLACADVVIESARPRGLEQLGYEAERWVQARPERIWVSITGYGRTAPARDWVAFGDDAAVAAGLAWPAAVGNRGAGSADPSDTIPCFCADAIADPLTGLHAAVAVLGHLRSGRGGLLDLALVDVAARCAGIDAEPRALPVERQGGHWVVRLEDGSSVPVVPPRARTPRAPAPALDPQGYRRWTEAGPPC